MLLFTHDKKRLSKHFMKDQVLFAYHLGDLDDFMFADCQWAVTYGDRPHIQDVILMYSGLSTPTMLAFGLTGHFDGLLKEMLQIAPRRFHGHFQKQHQHLFEEAGFHVTPYGSAWKMRFTGDAVTSVDTHEDDHIVRLDTSHEDELRNLYARAYPDNYFDNRMLQTGKYLGYVDSDQIVADASYRGSGLATILTDRLVAELVAEGKTVCLNVMGDNAPAIRCYEKLAFVKVHEYEEALFER